MSDNVLFSIEDVDYIHAILLACQICLYATDQVESQRKMMPETRPSSLTKEVMECLEMVDSAIKQTLMDKRERAQAAAEIPLAGYDDE